MSTSKNARKHINQTRLPRPLEIFQRGHCKDQRQAMDDSFVAVCVDERFDGLYA